MEIKRLKELNGEHVQSCGQPEYGLTDKQWQQDLAVLKLRVTPHPKGRKKMSGKYICEHFRQNGDQNIEYPGMTDWQSYCRYINDVLKVIQKGGVDYCYYKYQILELLKFHYDTLKTQYHDGQGYWSVWLERRRNV